MKLHAPFVQLPLQFDAPRLAGEAAVFAAAAWRPHERLQGVRVLPLVCINGEPDSGGARGPMRPTAHLAHCPYLQEVLACLDAPWGRVSLVDFGGHLGTTHDADVSYYGADHMSLHVPVTTSSGMRFVGSGVEVRMEAGECWAIDTWREHAIVGVRSGECIHLVAEAVGGNKFRDLFANGRVRRQETPEWRPRFVAPSGVAVRLRFESANATEVMTPWELRERIGLLVNDARPHPRLVPVRDALLKFADAWHILWARYGPDVHGREAYERALKNVAQQMELEAPELRLSNRVAFLQALRCIILDTALSLPEEGGMPEARPAS